MHRTEESSPEELQSEVTQWLRKDIPKHNKIEILTLLAEALSLAKPGTGKQRDIIESIIKITPDAGRIAPVETIEALSKSVLWVGNEYIPHFAGSILMLQKPALSKNPDHALTALEQSLLVCYSVILPKNIHGAGRCNDVCLEWQRQTFFSIINTIETTPSIDPLVSASILKISEAMTSMSDSLQDIHQRITFLAHMPDEDSSWH